MINADIDEIMQWYKMFLENVEQVALSYEEQIEKLKGTVVYDEIATDFSEIGLFYAKKLLTCDWITKEQYSLAQSIDIKFDEMSLKQELWSDEALSEAVEWEECREIAKALLLTLQ